jgi:hypothetical protein
MSLREKIECLLGGWPPFDDGPRLLEITTPEGRLRCELNAVNPIACSFSCLTWESPRLAGAGLERLKLAADELSRRLNYLLEPVALVESDPLAGVAQMRSDPPQRNASGVTYYELLVGREGALSLCRFHRAPGHARAMVSAQVTREVLVRLAEDFAAASASAAKPVRTAAAARQDLLAMLEENAKRITVVDLSLRSSLPEWSALR